MCGRFSLATPLKEIIEHFELKQSFFMSPRYNICPGEKIPVLKTEGIIDFMDWGFCSAWMKQQGMKSIINSRSETILNKNLFKGSALKRRCLILADGYYEWKPVGRIKQPYYIRRQDKQPFAMAGIYENDTCAILTTVANTLTAQIHERMPLIFNKNQYINWLDVKTDLNKIKELLSFNPSSGFEMFPVSTRVNHPKFDNLVCIQSLQEG